VRPRGALKEFTMGWDDDFHVGNFSEIGESLRGMQDASVGAAAKQVALRGALGALAQHRFGNHAPVSKQMRAPYKDSGQISIKCIGTFTPQNWNASALPVVTGLTRVYKSFKPAKAIVTEIVKLTYTNDSAETLTIATSVTDASDLVLVSAFSGADNCFPNAPSESTGIAGPVFANNSLGNGISWPTINGGIDMTVSFAIEDTILFRAAPPAPFTSADLSSVQVIVRFGLLGPQLR
jgi:hypothetical protein